MLPGLRAYVHDSCIAGVGTLHASMLGLFTVAHVGKLNSLVFQLSR